MSDFAYFQEQDSEQFSFFRIPKILFSDERFRNLSSEAKILYGLMLDRVGLSRKNGWVDAEGNVYIHFTIEEMMSVLKWSRYRIFQLLDELDEKEPGIGLIERRRVGHCKPIGTWRMRIRKTGTVQIKKSTRCICQNRKKRSR